MTEIITFQRAALLLKNEVTYGTDPVPTGGSNAMLIQQGRIRFQANKLVREIDRAWLGARPFILTGRSAFIEFDFELMGNATKGLTAPISPILLCCGHAETLVGATSATYNPISSTFGSATGYFTIPSPNASGGTRHVVTGLKGTLTFNASINGFFKGHAVLQGQEAVLSDNAFPSQTLTGFQDPIGIDTATWAVTVNAFAVDAVELSLDEGAKVQLYETSEQKYMQIVGRDAQGFIRIHDTKLSDLNPYALAVAKTPIAIVSTITGGTNKNAVLNIPTAQLDMPERIDIDGASGLRIPFSAVPSAAGNDEYNLVFT